MKKINFLYFIFSLSFGQAFGFEFEIQTKDKLKRFSYGYILLKPNEKGKAMLKLWRGEKSNFVQKELKSYEYEYFLKQWKESMTQKEAKKYKHQNKKYDVPVSAVVRDENGPYQFEYNRLSTAPTYMDRRIKSWLNYLEKRILRTTSLKFRSLKRTSANKLP